MLDKGRIEGGGSRERPVDQAWMADSNLVTTRRWDRITSAGTSMLGWRTAVGTAGLAVVRSRSCLKNEWAGSG